MCTQPVPVSIVTKSARENARGARQKWMLRGQAFQLAAGKRTDRFARRLETGRGAKRFHERGRENERFRNALLSEFPRDVKLLRMQRDREICRQGPRSCRPDDNARFAREIAAHDRKFHVDRRVFAVLIFHFRFGQGRLRAGAPKDRLHAFVNEALFDEDREGAENFRFVGGVERQIRMLPIAERRRAA